MKPIIWTMFGVVWCKMENRFSVDKVLVIRAVFKYDPVFLRHEESILKAETHNLNGVIWSGFLPELFERLANMLNFKYLLFEPNDNAFGNRNASTGEWNGMIKELIDDKADVALNIAGTFERSHVVDFTIPIHTAFHTFFVARESTDYNFFMFFKPLKALTWLVIVILICLGTLVMSLTINYSRDSNSSEFSPRQCFTFVVGAFGSFEVRRWSLSPKNTPSR